MRKLTLLSAVFVLGILLSQMGYANGTYKYTSKPHLAIHAQTTTIDGIYVPVNVPVSDVRVALYAKTVMYSSLRVTLVSPHGKQVILKAESGNPTTAPIYGSLGSERSLLVFQQGGNPYGMVPNDRPINPFQPLANMNGEMSQGYWQIRIQDQGSFTPGAPQQGFLAHWVLMFNKQIIEQVQPFTPPINFLWPGGANLRGQFNGAAATLNDPERAQIPNNQGDGDMCMGPTNPPSVVLGVNGDSFPIIISGHPGAVIGTAANGYPSGRFIITIRVEGNYPMSGFDNAWTSDIGIYFGRSPSFTPPLPPPPGPLDGDYMQKNVRAGWPTGAGTTSSLQGGNFGSYGGVRLGACITPQFGDEGGYNDVTFDDLAFDQIADDIGLGPAGGFEGTFRPQEPLSSLNGHPVDGLYWVTVYDAFGDNRPMYGHIRVTYLQVQYIVGGGEISDPDRHQGFVGPFAGIPVPGAITGTPVGYLSDIVGVIPPYGENAKLQDPLLVFWATQKAYPRTASGYERIMAVDQNNYIPPSATHYHGPYWYPGSLDADPAVAGALVNVDALIVPEGDYNLRVNITQPRYDDDLTDNEMQSTKINVNPASLSYHGERLNYWSPFIDPQSNLYPTHGLFGSGSGMGVTFTLFQFPSTNVTSIDFKHDIGLLPNATVGNLLARSRISIWNTSQGYAGTPSTLVARSTAVNQNEYVRGNWRTYAVYPVDAQGNPDLNAGGSVDLPPGSYVVTLDNVDLAGGLLPVFPYTYKVIPALKDRHWSFLFSDRFGPLNTFSLLGTRLSYLSSNVASPPTNGWENFAARGYSNHTFAIRLNMVEKNDFGINYVRFSSQSTPNEALAVGQPTTPIINITAYSKQGGNRKDFTVYIGIYDAGDNLLYSDMVNVANAPFNGIEGYQTININMDSWTPQTGGLYTIKVFFTRNPDDQNPVNDKLEYILEVLQSPIVAYDDYTDRGMLNELTDMLRDRGASPTLVRMGSTDLSNFSNSSIFVMGSIDETVSRQLASAIASGSNVAFVFDRNDHHGSAIEKMDRFFGIERAHEVDYSTVKLGAEFVLDPTVQTPEVATIDLPEFTSKEDLFKYIASHQFDVIESPESMRKVNEENNPFTSVLPIATGSKYGDITFLGEATANLNIVYTHPSNRRPQGISVEQPLPGAFVLEQNYPNPFNPTTAISYSLPEASIVSLRVLDVLGREIATLVNSNQDAGSYIVSFKSLDFSGKKLTSGTYFYRLDATPVNGGTTFTSTKKMMLSK